MGDREAIEDRTISNARLIELLQEKDAKIYLLELELSDIKRLICLIKQNEWAHKKLLEIEDE